MTKDQVKQEIAHLLETITEQAEMVFSHKAKIPQVEIDILLSNVRSLYEELMHLGKLNLKIDFSTHENISEADIKAGHAENSRGGGEQPEIENLPQPEIIAGQMGIDESDKPAENFNAGVKPAAGETPPSENPDADLQAQILAQAAQEEQKSRTKKTVRTAGGLFDAQTSRGELFTEPASLKEKIVTSKGEKSVSDKLHHQKIDDLKKSIGINEKFLFINELFEGSNASYNEQIDKLNTSGSISQARSIIDSLIAKYNWDTSQEIVKKLLNLVERRFL